MYALFQSSLSETIGNGLPALSYLDLYVASLVVHAVFMGYVLAGSAYLAVAVAIRRTDEPAPLESLLRTWLPFMLSLAITVGIAPLLLIQVLYRPAFYTANLLLFHRWMAVVPVLIVGFYLLYLLKNRWGESRSRLVPIAISLMAAGCFVFIAWSWTENHLLGLAGQQTWTRQYVSPSIVYHSAEVLPRLAMWFCGTFAVLSVWLSWQLWWPQRRGPVEGAPGTRRAAVLGLAGIATSAACGGLYWLAMPQTHLQALSLPKMLIPWGMTLAGSVVTTGMLLQQIVSQRLVPLRLSLMSLAMLITLLGIAILREAIRVTIIGIEQIARAEAAAADVGGWWVFVACTLLNTVLIAWCLRSVLSVETLDGDAEESHATDAGGAQID